MISKKEAILETTKRLVVELGYHAVPMSMIAKEAGTGMGTIYNYFTTKDKLINELYLILVKQHAAFVFEAYDRNQSVKMKFIHFWSKFFDFGILYPTEFLFIDQITISKLLEPEVLKEAGELFHEPFEIFAQGQKEGIIKEGDLTRMNTFIRGAIIYLVKYVYNQKISSSDDTFQWTLTAAWDAIRK